MDQKNVWIAMAIILAMFFGYQFFYELPRMEREQALQEAQQQAADTTASDSATGDAVLPDIDTSTTTDGSTATLPAVETPDPQNMVTRESALAESPRVLINTPSLHGSIALKGARLDDLTLVKYRETVDPNSPEVDAALARRRALTPIIVGIRMDRPGRPRRETCPNSQDRVASLQTART